MDLVNTLGNREWLRRHENSLKALLPEQWTLIHNLDVARIAYELKLIGVDWRTPSEFGKVMLFLEKVGILERVNGFTIRRGREPIFR